LTGIEASAKFKCPVCQARFRDSRTCLRCGADLAPLLLLIDQAYRLRQRARWALESGDVERAQEAAAEAENVCSTQSGRDLWLLSSWLLNGIDNVRPSGSPRQPATTIPFTVRTTQLIPVRFTLKNATANQGDRIFLAGNTAELGKWAQSCPTFHNTEGPTVYPNDPNWVLSAAVPAGQMIRFKFIKIAADGTVAWEKGSHHTYTVPTSGEGSVTVNWQC
jgi:Starch binding domain